MTPEVKKEILNMTKKARYDLTRAYISILISCCFLSLLSQTYIGTQLLRFPVANSYDTLHVSFVPLAYA